MGHPDFRVRRKIFATLGYPSAGWGVVRLTPDQQEFFVQVAPEVFVPVKGAWGRRGATCRCTWAILATKPARALGIVRGCVVNLSVARRGWAAVSAYTLRSGSEGALETYAYKDGEYRRQIVTTLMPHVVESYARCEDNKDCCP